MHAPSGGAAAVQLGLVIGAVVSAGFLLVFGVAGLLVTIGLRSIIDWIPWAALVIGGGRKGARRWVRGRGLMGIPLCRAVRTARAHHFGVSRVDVPYSAEEPARHAFGVDVHLDGDRDHLAASQGALDVTRWGWLQPRSPSHSTASTSPSRPPQRC